MSSGITLRPVERGDLDAIAAFSSDPESNDMAMVRPRSDDEFAALWDSILSPGSDTVARVIERDGGVVGFINAFTHDGETYVGYWVDRAHWGRGIATAAMGVFLGEVERRPLFAVVAATNVGSARVLERCGFVKIGERDAPDQGRYRACLEASYRLD